MITPAAPTPTPIPVPTPTPTPIPTPPQREPLLGNLNFWGLLLNFFAIVFSVWVFWSQQNMTLADFQATLYAEVKGKTPAEAVEALEYRSVREKNNDRFLVIAPVLAEYRRNLELARTAAHKAALKLEAEAAAKRAEEKAQGDAAEAKRARDEANAAAAAGAAAAKEAAENIARLARQGERFQAILDRSRASR